MTFRTLARIALTAGLLGAFASAARADAPQPAHAPVEQIRSSGWYPITHGFDLLASVGYGVATSRIRDIAIEPYGASFGLESGYTFLRGVRLGAYVHYGLGRTRTSTHEPLLGDSFEVQVDATGLTAGASVGYDLPLRFLVLRYTLDFGLSWMHWDFGELPVRPVLGFDADKDSVIGFHVAPGMSVLWPIRKFVVGLGFDYWIQVEDRIPPGILTKLLLGVRL